jgi:HTH-type transcriptional regulator / antitoxin HigA
MEIRPIRSDADHAAALEEIQRLWDEVEPGTPEGDRFEVLSTLVDAYERQHFPMPAPDPISAILFRMEQQGLTKKDLLPVFKTTARMSEVLGRKRRLNLSMIRALNQQLSIPLECLVGEYEVRRARSPRQPSARQQRPAGGRARGTRAAAGRSLVR